MLLFIGLIFSRLDDDSILNLYRGELVTYTFTPTHENFTKRFSLDCHADTFTHTAIKIDGSLSKGSVTYLTKNNTQITNYFSKNLTYIAENRQIKTILFNIQNNTHGSISFTIVAFNSTSNNMQTIISTQSNDVFAIRTSAKTKGTIYNYVNFESTNVSLTFHSKRKNVGSFSYITEGMKVRNMNFSENTKIANSHAFALTFESKYRSNLIIKTGNKSFPKGLRIAINKNLAITNNLRKNRQLLDTNEYIGILGATLTVGHLILLNPLLICLACTFSNRCYRTGCRWACCFFCCCKGNYTLFGNFYLNRPNYRCYWGDCFGFCTHGSCNCTHCCWNCANYPDARPWFGIRCCLYLQFMLLFIMFSVLFSTFFLQLFLISNLCCSCDSNEANFENSCRLRNYNNSEITSNLLDQTTGERRDPEVPIAPEGVIGYVDQQGQQLPYRRPTYVTPPMTQPQQNEDENSPYHPENPYN
ncbi:hypothetical protein TVAG_280450 [Trichomonas vaginalis G3]|uniref:Uncharacterized protein n=1 Tax=Trichomonas vaginalis (strain ATCC PRA-98 / G3) TaxID=412133 RepID=A2DRG6_TRIV3|nr:hypothetical protein TVAG_280450 [Trichomonas vaginalis G3]|eukprot:XP_001329152.1 hypothetical protein [Trichomonas vaginalis G3]